MIDYSLTFSVQYFSYTRTSSTIYKNEDGWVNRDGSTHTTTLTVTGKSMESWVGINFFCSGYTMYCGYSLLSNRNCYLMVTIHNVLLGIFYLKTRFKLVLVQSQALFPSKMYPSDCFTLLSKKKIQASSFHVFVLC